MKLLKKLFISLGLLSSFTASVKALTISLLVTNATFVNIVPNYGSAKLTQIIATAQGTNQPNFVIYDAPTNNILYTNAAYTNIISYATNYVTTWTNYYGATNSFTNLSLVDVTNSVAAVTSSYPARITASIPSNSVVRFDNVNYYFSMGPWITNSGGLLSLTVTYQQ